MLSNHNIFSSLYVSQSVRLLKRNPLQPLLNCVIKSDYLASLEFASFANDNNIGFL